MLVDAIILTGGRSSRLGFVAKSEFVVGQRTLLERTLDAVSDARRIVIVGPETDSGVHGAESLASALPATVRPSSVRPGSVLADSVLHAREDPPFDGPVSGIAAGLAALATQPPPASDAILILACDMPHIARAVPRLLAGLQVNPGSDGVIALDADGRLQPLAAGYRTSSLASAIATHQSTGSLAGMPMIRLIDGMQLEPIDVPEDSTADVDSWDDAERLGARAPSPAE